MKAVKSIFVCASCGTSHPKWMGKCTACDEWNTIQEELVSKKTIQIAKQRKASTSQLRNNQAELLSELSDEYLERKATPDQELNRVLGGGIVSGSIVLIGGQPGIGKSTLLLHLAMSLKDKVLYVSGEESKSQIKSRAERMGWVNNMCFVSTETEVDLIIEEAKRLKPAVLIVDSIQTIYSAALENTPGSITQVRECTWELQKFAKESHTPVFVIGHINKEGSIAGPKLLEHIVDTVIQFEGDQNHSYRILRTLKNRFGSTAELGIYEMKANGLRQVANPSELLISQKDEVLSGSAISSSIEGVRPLLIEVQALVGRAIYGTPQRSATGLDLRRLHMLLAVLEKRCGLPFAANDVFLNIVGGLKVNDPGIDLSIIVALISSLNNIPVSDQYTFCGEVGLSGEVRSIKRIEQRIKEADRLGFDKIFLSKYNLKGLDTSNLSIEICPVGKVEDMLEVLFS